MTNEFEKEEQLINLDKKKTNLKKMAFIQEIKNGLGNEIKANPNTIEIMEKPKINKIKILLKRIFKIF